MENNEKPLKIIKKDCKSNKHINCSKLYGDCSWLSGDCSKLYGDCSWLSGDCSGLYGDCSGLSGDCSGLSGNCSGLSGNLNKIPTNRRQSKISEWVGK